MAHHNAEVVSERSQSLAGRRLVLLAQATGADVGYRLLHYQIMALCEEREQAARMVVGGWELTPPRSLPRELSGHRLRRGVCDRGGIAVPRRSSREACEIWEELGVECAVAVAQRRHRQLVEDHVHDRRRRSRRYGRRT